MQFTVYSIHQIIHTGLYNIVNQIGNDFFNNSGTDIWRLAGLFPLFFGTGIIGRFNTMGISSQPLFWL